MTIKEDKGVDTSKWNNRANWDN